jgi:putative ABC transport system permease protein
VRLWSYTRRELFRRPGRTFLTLMGIVIGVAAIVAVSAVSTSTRQAYRDMFEAVSGKAALEVVAQGQSGFDPAVAGTVAAVPGVETVVPVVQAPAALLTGAGRVVVMALGVDPSKDRAARAYELESGALLPGMEAGVTPSSATPATGVLLEGSFARSQGLAVGSAARLITPSGTVSLPVVGLLQPQGTAAFNGGALVILSLLEAQRLFGLPGQVNGLQLVLRDGADEKAVEADVARRVPEGLTVQVPGTRGQIAQDSLLSTEQGLNIVSALSLVAATFIVLNAFLMSVGERRRDLALLRALGVTRRQVVRLILREAFLLGLAGTALGMAIGFGAATVLTGAMEQLLLITLPPIRLNAAPFVLAVVLGMGVSLIAAYAPARLGARTTPLEGMVGDGGREESGGRRRWPSLVGMALAACALAVAIGLAVGKVPADFSAPAMAFLVVGLVLAIPLAIGPLSRLVAAGLHPLLGLEGGLASRQLRRHPTRTSLTVGVLFVAVTVTITIGSGLLNNVRDMGDWYRRTIVGDYFVRGAMPDMGTSMAAALPERLAGEIAALPSVDRVDPLRFVQGTVDGRPVVILARTFAAGRPLPMDLQQGDPKEVLAGLAKGQVVIGTMLAQKLGLVPGDELTLATRQGPQRLRVAGTVTEYTAGGSALYMEWGTAKRLLGIQGADLFMVAAKPGKVAALGTELKVMAARQGLLLQSLSELKTFIDSMFRGVLGILWLLMGMIFVVASLGIVNTLTMNVLEQTRELGLLRAVAMTRGQVRRMILAQALHVGVISLIPGVVAGVGMAFLSNRATYSLLGNRVEFRIDPMLVVGSFVVALAIAMAAAYLPARRAARLPVVEALQYE